MNTALRTFLQSLKTLGPIGACRAIASRLRVHMYISNLAGFECYFSGKKGLEIGGPSRLFRSGGAYGIYRLAGDIDNCNFSGNTTWEGRIQPGATFTFDGSRTGHQYICEGTELSPIKSEDYDFVLSSHVLEHIANPIKALLEWKRVLRQGGVLFLRLPHRDGTFDHRRPVTTLSHMEEDLRLNVNESDPTHLAEILHLHDLSMDPGAGDSESFTARCQKNRENRCLHHHVFTTETAIQLVDLVGLEILLVRVSLPYDITIICRKLHTDASTVHRHNSAYMSGRAEWRGNSPFPSDSGRNVHS